MDACSFPTEIRTHLGLDRSLEHKIKGVPSPVPGDQHCGKDPHPQVQELVSDTRPGAWPFSFVVAKCYSGYLYWNSVFANTKKSSCTPVPSKQTKACALCFVLLFQSFGQTINCKSIKNLIFVYFSDYSSESVACQSKPLRFACHLGIFNRSWSSKSSTFPCDKGSALKNTRIKPATVLNKNKKKDLN